MHLPLALPAQHAATRNWWRERRTEVSALGFDFQDIPALIVLIWGNLDSGGNVLRYACSGSMGFLSGSTSDPMAGSSDGCIMELADLPELAGCWCISFLRLTLVCHWRRRSSWRASCCTSHFHLLLLLPVFWNSILLPISLVLVPLSKMSLLISPYFLFWFLSHVFFQSFPLTTIIFLTLFWVSNPVSNLPAPSSHAISLSFKTGSRKASLHNIFCFLYQVCSTSRQACGKGSILAPNII